MSVPVVGHAVRAAEVGGASGAGERAEDHDLGGDRRGVASDGEPAEPQALDARIITAAGVVGVQQVHVGSGGRELPREQRGIAQDTQQTKGKQGRADES